MVESADRNLPLSTMSVNLLPKLSARLLSCSRIFAENSAGAGTLFPYEVGSPPPMSSVSMGNSPSDLRGVSG